MALALGTTFPRSGMVGYWAGKFSCMYILVSFSDVITNKQTSSVQEIRSHILCVRQLISKAVFLARGFRGSEARFFRSTHFPKECCRI